ncbi:MAG TPA: rod shape-determining protein MreD [Calditrichia bacterium]|nr:rod shape-determining protein MreD [Calditrichota bacterium]HQU71636.1 rod shape-determining protein MreD [Calditrichia bacterium]HQV31793.1 rod shape-determining protein MreD [Calditrichia bacterium]
MNKEYGWFVVIFIAVLFIQSTVVDFLISAWKPDLVLITLVIFAARYGRGPGATAGFLVGIISDVMSGPGTLIGLGALAKTITGYFAGSWARIAQEPSQFIFILFFSGLVHDVLYFSISTLGIEIEWWVLLQWHMFGSLLFTTIVGLLVYLLVGRRVVEKE